MHNLKQRNIFLFVNPGREEVLTLQKAVRILNSNQNSNPRQI